MKSLKFNAKQKIFEYWHNGTPVQIQGDFVENAKSSPVKIYLNSTYYQFGNPCTKYSFGAYRENTVKTPYGDYDCVGGFELSFDNNKFVLTPIEIDHD